MDNNKVEPTESSSASEPTTPVTESGAAQPTISSEPTTATAETPQTTPQPTAEATTPTASEDTPSAQDEAPLPAPETTTPVAKKSSSKKVVKMLIILVLVLCIPLAAFGGYTMSKQKSDKTVASLNGQIAVLNSNEHDVPAGAVKVSDCVPNMGAHYVTKTSDSRYGPFLLVNKKNKVIGVEYMVSKDMYTAIPKTDPPVELVTKDSPMYGWKFDHAEVSHLPLGHEGLLVDHVDVHIYTVTAAQQKNACIQ